MGRMATSYAVLWCEAGGTICTGELKVLRTGFRLDGADRSGVATMQEVDCDEIVSTRIGRTAADRVAGRSSLIVERSGSDRLLITSAVGIGVTREIAERLGHLTETSSHA